MNNDRFDVKASTLRELGSTEIDAVGGADNASSWTTTTTITITTTLACTLTTTTTTTLTTTGNEEVRQA